MKILLPVDGSDYTKRMLGERRPRLGSAPYRPMGAGVHR
jgi:hypothetical protein